MKIELLKVGDLETNCYLLIDEVEQVCAIVDPGGDARRIIGEVEAAGVTPSAILLTHGHYDHVGAVRELHTHWPDVPIYLNRRDVYHGDVYLHRLFPMLPASQNYDDGDVVSIGSLKVEVLATPGHTEGSVTLRCNNVLFCGDTLFAGSMGRTDFPGGSMKKIFTSLKRLAHLEGSLEVYPGHMELSDLDRERNTNPYVKQALKD